MLKTISIRDLNHAGEGVGVIEGKICFVPGLLPGEEALVEVTEDKKRFQRARVIKRIKSSSHRREAPCAHQQVCGGCPLMPWDDLQQFSWKKDFCEKTMEKIAGIAMSYEDLFPAEQTLHYRNKLTLFLEKGRLGLRKPLSQELAPIISCPLGDRSFQKFYTLLEGRRELSSVILRKADEGVLVVLIGKRPPDESFLDQLERAGARSIYFAREAAEGSDQYLCGEKWLPYAVMGRSFSLTPRSFFQINPEQSEKLYRLVKTYAEPIKDEVILDLYSGQGTLGAYLSEGAKAVVGIEANGEAVRYGRKNLPQNMQLIHAKVEDTPLPQADTIILDPPRAGLKPSVIERIKEIRPKKIIYVSCNPVTQARDLALLKDYRILRAGLVDLFPQTSHVETVVLMSRVNKQV